MNCPASPGDVAGATAPSSGNERASDSHLATGALEKSAAAGPPLAAGPNSCEGWASSTAVGSAGRAGEPPWRPSCTQMTTCEPHAHLHDAQGWGSSRPVAALRTPPRETHGNHKCYAQVNPPFAAKLITTLGLCVHAAENGPTMSGGNLDGAPLSRRLRTSASSTRPRPQSRSTQNRSAGSLSRLRHADTPARVANTASPARITGVSGPIVT
jgi:hypothetical protein